MATKKNASATSDAKTVTFDVSRDGADEFYRSRAWDDKGNVWLVIKMENAFEKYHDKLVKPVFTLEDSLTRDLLWLLSWHKWANNK
jgi:hypothetical protein